MSESNPTIAAITFKDEGDINGKPIGPITVTLPDASEIYCGWLRLSDAQYLADQYSARLELA
jgi:hypothetical protein